MPNAHTTHTSFERQKLNDSFMKSRSKGRLRIEDCGKTTNIYLRLQYATGNPMFSFFLTTFFSFERIKSHFDSGKNISDIKELVIQQPLI